MKGVKLQARLDSCTSEQERMTIFEHFGDLSYDVLCPEKAIEYYQKQVRNIHFDDLICENLVKVFEMFFFHFICFPIF